MSEPIRRVGAGNLHGGPATAGMMRHEAFTTDAAWFGEVENPAASLSEWHHHGDHTTFGRVVTGKLRFEFGADGQDAVEVGAGDYFMVPPHTVHREGNPADEDALIVLARVGNGPTVFNVEGPERATS